MHFAHVTVGEKPTVWQSKQAFRRHDDVMLRFWSDGRELVYSDGWHGGCHMRIYGWGVAVRVDVCGDRVPIRIRAVSVARKRHLRIGWRVERK